MDAITKKRAITAALANLNGYDIQPYEDDFEHGWTVYNERSGFYAETTTQIKALNIVDKLLKTERKQLGL